MNITYKQKQQRNITPNFMRYKKNNSTKKTAQQTKQQQNKTTERSSSKASKCSFDVYEKKVLNLSKLKNTLTIKKKNEQSLDKKIKPVKLDLDSKRTSSNQKLTDHNNFNDRQNLAHNTQNRLNPSFLSKKRTSGSGNLIKPKSKQRYSNPKRQEQSLQKQEQRAKLQNNELLNNLMKHQHIPNYMNKLKIKKQQNVLVKKITNVVAKQKKRFFEDESIQLKSEQKLKNYEIYGQLGQGAYGIVKMALDKATKQKVAIKIYQKSKLDEPNKIKNIERQIVILNRISNPTIARLIQTIQTSQQIYLILQYGGANSLYKYLLSKPQHRLTQSEAKSIFKTILTAINYLHQKNIVHRDIKAENILLNRFKQLKLIDFGFSLRCGINETIDTFCGTPTYMAPEIVSKRDHVPIYTDMWSIGILFYVMLQGNYPFRAKSQNELFEKIKRGAYEYIHNDISQKSKLLIKGLLCVNPLERYTAKELMSEQWLKWYDSNSENGIQIK